MFRLVTYAPYDYAWFHTFDEAYEAWANMTHPSPNAYIEIQFGDFYWTIQLTTCTYRPVSQLPV